MGSQAGWLGNEASDLTRGLLRLMGQVTVEDQKVLENWQLLFVKFMTPSLLFSVRIDDMPFSVSLTLSSSLSSESLPVCCSREGSVQLQSSL